VKFQANSNMTGFLYFLVVFGHDLQLSLTAFCGVLGNSLDTGCLSTVSSEHPHPLLNV
jgi:hypothetical protein